MQDVKLQLAGRLKDTSSVLVSVSNNPSIDQLAACLALTLMLNKLGKHATAVFGGEVPSLINFLHPEQTIKKNTDSLRDFIISLDKEKADKLRYKLENEYVKIFITPYNTTLSQKDLVFSQGDVNVEVIVALGVHSQEELDRAILANGGRILHDAAVTTITTKPISNLGSINWSNERASSLCEMLTELAEVLGPNNLIDAQIANALLTGIVAETGRFSNEKTSSVTMSVGSRLLALGANQQLVSAQLAPVEKKEEKQEKEQEKEEKEPKELKEQKEDKPVDKKPPAPPPPPINRNQPPPVEIKKAAPPQHKEKGSNDFKIDHIDPDSLDDLEGVDDSNPIAQVSIDDQGNMKQQDEDSEVVPDTPTPATPPSPPLSDHPFMNNQAQSSGGYLVNNTGPSPGSPLTPPPMPGPNPASDSVNEALKSSTTPSLSQFVSVGQDGVKGIDPNLTEPRSPDASSDDGSNDSPPPFAPPIIPPPNPN